MTISGSIGAASGRRLERKLFAKVAKSLEPGEEPLVGFIAQAPGEISKNVGAIAAVGGANLFNAGVRVGALSRLSANSEVPAPTGTAFRAGLVLTDRAVIGVELNRDAMPKKAGPRNARGAFLGATYLDSTYKIAGAEIRSGAIFMRDGRALVFEISLASRVKFEEFCDLLERARRSDPGLDPGVHRIVLEADWGLSGVWERTPGPDDQTPLELDELPISAALRARLEAWSAHYESQRERSDYPLEWAFRSAAEEQAFIAEGAALAGLLQEELGADWAVSYRPPPTRAGGDRP